jgi:hypothetical protein
VANAKEKIQQHYPSVAGDFATMEAFSRLPIEGKRHEGNAELDECVKHFFEVCSPDFYFPLLT